MSRNDREDNFEWLVQLEYAEPEEGCDGPPASWPYPSWFNRKSGEWYYNGKPDPCPVKALGHNEAGEYIFVTALRTVRRFSSSALHGGGGPNDLFGGKLAWAWRHFRRWDVDAGKCVGGLKKQQLMGAMIDACDRAGYYGNATPYRSIGIWREADGEPVIHLGDVILHAGRVIEPGDQLGDHRYVMGDRRAPPALEFFQDGKTYELKPGTVIDCQKVVSRIGEWNWLDEEGRDLFVGGLFCDMLGDALHWKPHRFIRAMPGAGKSTLLKYMQALLGSAAHPVQRNFTRARLEQKFSNTACALLLDEMESDTDGEKMRRVFELVRLLSDDGATGGRGTPSGASRDIDLHGTVTMVATLAEAWRPQDRSRIAYIELGRLSDREGHQARSQEEMESAAFAEAAELSPKLRARAITCFPLFRENLAKARARILELGGAARDADQLGYLIAGWATMTGDRPLDDTEVRDLERFKPYIMTVVEEADGTDDPSDCLHTLFGLKSGYHESGRDFTIGKVITLARDPDKGLKYRDVLKGIGLRLDQRTLQATDYVETSSEAWLAVANKHPQLEKLFADYPQYQTPKRAQILQGLKRTVNGVPYVAKATEGPMKFDGTPSRAWLIPPIFLPSLNDDSEAVR